MHQPISDQRCTPQRGSLLRFFLDRFFSQFTFFLLRPWQIQCMIKYTFLQLLVSLTSVWLHPWHITISPLSSVQWSKCWTVWNRYVNCGPFFFFCLKKYNNSLLIPFSLMSLFIFEITSQPNVFFLPCLPLYPFFPFFFLFLSFFVLFLLN